MKSKKNAPEHTKRTWTGIRYLHMPGLHARARGGSGPELQPAPAQAWETPHAARASTCADCGQPLPLSGGYAVVRDGAVTIVHARCEQNIQPANDPASGPRRIPKLARPAVLITAIAVGLVVLVAPREEGVAIEPQLLAIEGGTALPTPDDERLGVHVAPKERPLVHDLTLAEDASGRYTLTWYHPLAGHRVLPGKPDRRFGANRQGDRPAECGRGHCGVDIGSVRGRIVHAVRPGVVERIVRDPSRSGGKYVRLRHPEGFITHYMHLDRIRPDLVVGVEVAAGEPLGVLGRTGIHHSVAHLHFSVAKRTERGDMVFLDPEPMLREAVVLAESAPYPWPKTPVHTQPSPDPDTVASAATEAVPHAEIAHPAADEVKTSGHLSPVTESLASPSLYSGGLSQ